MPRHPLHQKQTPAGLSEALIAARFPDRVSRGQDYTGRLSEDALHRAVDHAIAAHCARHDDLWIFAYGSLLWHPELEIEEERVATVHGFHRRFCLWQRGSRGTVECPALMMAIDAGGTCHGVLYRVRGPDIKRKTLGVFRRELGGDGYRARWVDARTPRGPVRAVTFVANRDTERYAGRLSLEHVADVIASACGPKGANAQYLLYTHVELRRRGLRDRTIEALDRMVAQRMLREADPG